MGATCTSSEAAPASAPGTAWRWWPATGALDACASSRDPPDAFAPITARAAAWSQASAAPLLAVSVDGGWVYVATAHGILTFARNPRTGVIHLLSGGRGCVDARDPSCRPLRGITVPTGLAAAPDDTLYATGTLPLGRGSDTGAVAVLTADSSGALSQLPGPTGCLVAPARAAAQPRRASTPRSPSRSPGTARICTRPRPPRPASSQARPEASTRSRGRGRRAP